MDVLQLRHSRHGAAHAGPGGAEGKLGELLAASGAHLAFEFAAQAAGGSTAGQEPGRELHTPAEAGPCAETSCK